MATKQTAAREIEVLENLQSADSGSYYTIRGAGGDLNQWVTGYEGLLDEAGIGRPKAWFKTNGGAVNAYVNDKIGGQNGNPFPSDLTILLFPLDGLDLGKLAVFRLTHDDKWFDDKVASMRGRR